MRRASKDGSECWFFAANVHLVSQPASSAIYSTEPVPK